MLKQFNMRFFDTDKHKLGVYETISALNIEQADDFAHSIIMELFRLDNDWNKEVAFEFITRLHT